MLSKKTISLVALAAAGVLIANRSSSADTITVHSLGLPVTVATGPFAGDKDYTYDIAFDNQADVIAPNNGFMVIDFGAVASSTLTGPAGLGATLAGEFTLSTQPTGAGLAGYAGNTANTDHFVDPVSGNRSDPTDLTPILNAVFFYNNAVPYTAIPVDLTLDLITTSTAPPKLGNGFGVDTSGAGGGLSFALNSVFVPSTPVSVPLPLGWIGGAALVALIGFGRAIKARRVEA